MVELDEKSQLLLNVIQDDVAFDERPYKKLGEKIEKAGEDLQDAAKRDEKK